jgi:hypothetical protein
LDPSGERRGSLFPNIALALSGGVALGAYQAGAYAALHACPALWPGHISASSVGQRPTTLAHATVRTIDLFFGNQTVRALRAFEPAEALRRDTNPDAGRVTVVPISYSGGLDEPGPQKLFDFSTVALAERWEAGRADMSAAIASLDGSRSGPPAHRPMAPARFAV